MILTDSFIKKVKIPPKDQRNPDKYSEDGLQLQVFATGRKSWAFAYRFEGKQKTPTIGTYPNYCRTLITISGEPNTVCALKLAILVFVRPIELIGQILI